ncbi:uncharacterized protein PHALS_01768 [Plasmopara halstedii]|uniref:Uncharacterized protein n=1 Tax=Plasmopara halstedii TaxID=4781 RepID=A0A0P1ATD5_PLAHL|nr:uncharacterized protein PHALS_01768 [Plasmopara halstedii]CEG45476.1 hypothetical protein PHALS_01768 [Plasmopara halstedii]|eukprot:XP_024581845.1 hypothetical protein PHALS_01768 [Plasmopara halstedii]
MVATLEAQYGMVSGQVDLDIKKRIKALRKNNIKSVTFPIEDDLEHHRVIEVLARIADARLKTF